MEILRGEAIAEVDAGILRGESTSFADSVRSLIKHPAVKGEYKYGEEFEGDMPKVGEDWTTAEDDLVRNADLDDLEGLSCVIEAMPAEKCSCSQGGETHSRHP